MKTKLKSHF